MGIERRAFDEVFEQKLNEIIEYNKRQDKLIGKVHEILTGNGDPEKGLVVRHTRLSERIKLNSAMLKIYGSLLIIVIGAIVKLAFF